MKFNVNDYNENNIFKKIETCIVFLVQFNLILSFEKTKFCIYDV